HIGDHVVARQTVLGTIHSGMGHVHFIDGEYGDEINALRSGGGLTPYNDPWPPKIVFVKFFQDGTDNEFKTPQLSGRVDIVVKVAEQNAPPSAPISERNNGTYKLGFQILTEDGDSVIFRASGSGYQFKFDSKPSNSYVHNVFYKKLSSTSSHVYFATNRVRSNYYWDTRLVPEGNYQVMVYAEDTRSNADTVVVPVEVKASDTNPPAAPIFKYIRTQGNGFQLAWYPNTEPDLAGYRLYYSHDNIFWRKIQGTEIIPADSTTKTFRTYVTSPLYFKLTAVDNAAIPNESEPSDVYGLCMARDYAKPKFLIVDGFDRTVATGGVWQNVSHAFGVTYGEAVWANDQIFDMCSNDAIVDSSIDLHKYLGLIWFTGDEGEADETLSPEEQQKLQDFLQQDGRLFLSGANVAWDLDLDSDCYSTTEADNEFLNSILQADFAGKISAENSVSGIAGVFFDRVNFSLTKADLPVDSIDVIAPLQSSTPCLAIDSTHVVGIQSRDALAGNLIFFSFPFEMIQNSEKRGEVMGKILEYLSFFDGVNDKEEKEIANGAVVAKFSLNQNFPNPFSGQTAISYRVPLATQISIKIYNVLGQEVRVLLDQKVQRGSGQIFWDGKDALGRLVPEGVYFYVLETGKERFSHKIIFLH
ncbi:MAG: T9SS type A sorting domain-containing protein, partial [Calditrichaeota bacterium]|nr:T9SS type A sorting domain-containing protein [Calditrichota bacterium]